LTVGGAHLRLGVVPDIAVFAKALGNGHPMAAIIGTGEAMRGAHDSFISSTYWTEGIGPAAALATVRKMRRVDVPGHCMRMGSKVQNAWREAAKATGAPVRVPNAYPALAHLTFEHPQSQELRTLYTQEMLKRGFLAGPAFYVTLAHTDAIIDRYIEAIHEVFRTLAEIMDSGRIASALEGPVAHTGFRRLL
jgi:glutamate-1-semialdehyde 2,1-aminomutase